MTERSSRRRIRDRIDRFEDNRIRAIDIHRGALTAGVEVLTGAADVAGSFLRELAETEPFSRSGRWSDVGRNLPDSLVAAEDAAINEFLEIPRKAVNRFYDVTETTSYDREDEPMPRRTTKRTVRRTSYRRESYSRQSVSRSEQRIIDLVTDYLEQVPSGGATLNAVVDHVVLETDYDAGIVRSVIERHFVVVGPVVSNQSVVDIDTRAMDTVVDWMEDVLRQQGYSDFREDYKLTGIPDLDEEAALVAFDGEDPAVLCYPVDDGEVDNPAYFEAAKFQAGVIAPGKVARVAWVSDGHSSYIFDMEQDRVLTRLPRRRDRDTPDPDTSAVVKAKR